MILRYLKEDGFDIITASLKDKFGDYGLIGLCALEKMDDQWTMIELTYSCRAMGKKVEGALLSKVCQMAQQEGCHKISIKFKKTTRNKQMRNILRDFGTISFNFFVHS